MKRTLKPEDQISRYRVVGPLGAGGMGEVYIAKDESLNRNVALKVLPAGLVKNEERVRRFITEAQSASSLNHPNIVTIYEIGQDRVRGSDPIHFISMELVAGETLGQKIHDEKLDLRTLLGYLAQAAEGIAKAHAAGIVHRDLKPGNIMVSKDGFTKVLDFGLAKLTEKQGEFGQDATSAPTAAPATGEGVIMGTAGYMSPEQVQGKIVDHRSDIFSMGCVLYEAATRKRPFAADSDLEVMHRILKDRPTPVEELNPQVPVEVRRNIRRCLAKSPDQRFQTMKDLAIELREAHDEYESLAVSSGSAPSMTSVPSGGAIAPKPARSGRTIGIAAAAVVVVALVVGAYVVMGHKKKVGNAGGPPAAEMKLNVLMSRDDLGEAILSSDGRYLAYVATAEEKTSLNVRQVRTGSDVKILPPQEYPIHGISFSPDGDYLYYQNQDPGSPAYSALFQVASLGGTPRKVFFDVDTAAGVSPDGLRVAFRRGRPQDKVDTLIVGDLATGSDRELARVSQANSFTGAPAWSPDGKRVATALRSVEKGFQAWIAVFDVESGRQETIGSKSFNFIGSLAWLPDGSALIATGSASGSQVSQIHRFSYPGGETRRLTNDLNGYTGLSLASAGKSLAAIRRTDVNNVWVVEATGGKDAHPITNATGPVGSSTEPLPLPDGSLVFTTVEGDKNPLCRSSADGSGWRTIVPSGLANFGAVYAERAGILFTQLSEKEMIPHVWRVDPDGGGLRQLTDGKGEFLGNVSRDGATAVFIRIDEGSLWSVNPVSGGEPKQLASSTEGEGTPPVVSPDGRLIRYSEFTTVDGRIYSRSVVIPSQGGEPVARVLLPPGASFTTWSPDSKSMTYIDRNKGWNLMRQPIAGGVPSEITKFTEGVTTDFAWSPDGARLVVTRRIGQKAALYAIQPGKGEPQLLIEFRTGAITACRFTPDSKSVVFTYGTSSKDVVLISDFQ